MTTVAFTVAQGLPASSQNPRPVLQQCDEDHEAKCLAATGGLAERKGQVLTIKFENGKTKTFKSNEIACEKDDANHCLRVRLVGYLSEPKYFIVSEFGYEGGDVWLRNGKTGESIKINDLKPKFSPDFHKLAISSGGYGESEVEISIIDVSREPIKNEYRKKFGGDISVTWSIVKWIDDNVILLHQDVAEHLEEEPEIIWGQPIKSAERKSKSSSDFLLSLKNGKWE